jgi:hypothetical protein
LRGTNIANAEKIDLLNDAANMMKQLSHDFSQSETNLRETVKQQQQLMPFKKKVDVEYIGEIDSPGVQQEKARKLEQLRQEQLKLVPFEK